MCMVSGTVSLIPSLLMLIAREREGMKSDKISVMIPTFSGVERMNSPFSAYFDISSSDFIF